MRHSLKSLLGAFTGMLLIMPLAQAAKTKQCLDQSPETLYNAAWKGSYSALSPEQATTALALFDAALKWTADTPLAPVQALAQANQMEAFALCPQAGSGMQLMLRERPGQARGRGFFLFAPEHSQAAVLQIPHARADQHTGALGLSLLASGQVAAVALNTVHRYQQPSEPQGAYAHSDLAHQRYSYFQTMAEALARARDGHALIQLHGFANSKRRTLAGMQADIIVSSGDARVSPYSRAVSACLQRLELWRTELYPATIKELGATKNVTGQLYRRLGEAGFLHIELAHPVRAQLVERSDALQALGSCL